MNNKEIYNQYQVLLKDILENGDNHNNIWDGDAYKNYLKNFIEPICPPELDCHPDFYLPLTKEKFIERIKTDDEFAKKWSTNINRNLK